jgi:regulator of protease activity HflC (stomatin/prohibitin superfamily)
MFERLADLLAQFGGLFRILAVVRVYERGVILRLGKFRRQAGPGLHWLLPFGIDEVLTDNVVKRTLHLASQTLTTACGRTLVLSAVVTLEIEKIEVALLECESIDEAMADCCLGAIGEAVRASDWSVVASDDFSHRLSILCRRKAKEFGIALLRVQIADLAPTRAITLHHAAAHGKE